MSRLLPDHVDAARLAAQGATIAGEFPATALRRLAATYTEVQPVAATVTFALNELHQIVVRGHVRGALTGTCQRCLQPVGLAVSADFEHLPEVEEMLEPGPPPGMLDLLALVEDEVFLACPMIPRHESRECPAPADGSGGDPEGPGDAGRKNPFDVLASLRQTSKDQPLANDAAPNSEE